ncbi:MAG: DUF485 domain-containing protein [Bacteroidales bacterium]|nr:DUF485 domain-containing protein [Bacteroidales bacterium]
MLHGPAANLGDDNAAERKSKLGIKLFLIYALIYAGFVYIGVSYPDLMGIRLFFGLNLAIVYGFGLIVLAIIMGFLYHLACTRLENKLNKEEDSK